MMNCGKDIEVKIKCHFTPVIPYVDTEQALYISVGVLSSAWALLLVFTLFLWIQHRRLRSHVEEMASVSKLRVQKVKMRADSNHAYQNPDITPGEELSRRGYSMYSGEQDLESGQSQNSNPVFVEDVQRRHQPPPPPSQGSLQRQPPNTAPPFLLHAIETNKKKSLTNPIANNNQPRQTNSNRNSNPNFMY